MMILTETQGNAKENANTALLGFFSLMYVLGAVMVITYTQWDTLLLMWMFLYPMVLMISIGVVSVAKFIYQVTEALHTENTNDPALQRVFDAIGMYLYHPSKLPRITDD